MLNVIKVPRLSENDDYVTIVEWNVNDFAYVEKGKPICCVETSKALVEIEAGAAGYIKKAVDVLREVKTQSVIGYIADTKEELKDIKPAGRGDAKDVHAMPEKERPIVKSREPQMTSPSSKKVSLKALELAKKLKVDINQINRKVIRTKDIYAYKNGEETIGKKFSDIILKDKKFGGLSSKEKISLYRKNGAKIGDGVDIGEGTKIKSRSIEIGDNVYIGRDVYIEADRLKVGSFSSIGDNSEIVTGEVEIGRAVEIASCVKVDLSGGRNQDSKLIVGDGCLIASNAYINACRKVELRRNAALSPYSKIYTHGYWQSVLDGYPADFKGVTIKEDAWIGSGAQVMPGVVINRGSIVLSNSTVIGDVDEYVMAGGVPAQTIKKNLKKELPPDAKIQRLTRILKEFAEYLKFKQCEVELEENSDYFKMRPTHTNKARSIFLLKNSKIRDKFSNDIVLTFNGADISAYATFDLSALRFIGKEDVLVKELRNFLRRYGIRFIPLTKKMKWDEGINRHNI